MMSGDQRKALRLIAEALLVLSEDPAEAETPPRADRSPRESTRALKERARPDADSVPWSACGQVLRCVARAEDVPVALIHQVAAAALLELKDAGALAARALGEGPHALGAAIELAGRLLEQRAAHARRAG